MSHWDYTLRLDDVFHNENMSFDARRDEIVKRIRTSPFYDKTDGWLVDFVGEMANSDHVDEFDEWRDQFYDWCNLNRVWVQTRKAA
jgi:hypothetical protein